MKKIFLVSILLISMPTFARCFDVEANGSSSGFFTEKSRTSRQPTYKGAAKNAEKNAESACQKDGGIAGRLLSTNVHTCSRAFTYYSCKATALIECCVEE